MMGLNKLVTAITVVIAVTLAALVAEIIYVLWKRRRIYRPRGRVEPKEPSPPTSSPLSSNSEREHELELEQQVMKYQCNYGESRMLFTIKEEEERECCDSENGECSVMVLAKTVSLDEVVVMKFETTPFSTPCSSPPYHTPLSSPCREKDNNNNNNNNKNDNG